MTDVAFADASGFQGMIITFVTMVSTSVIQCCGLLM